MVEDINDMATMLQMKQSGEPVEMTKDTVMWNPLHFACYQGHLEVVKFISEELRVNISHTAPKAFASNEGDQVND